VYQPGDPPIALLCHPFLTISFSEVLIVYVPNKIFFSDLKQNYLAGNWRTMTFVIKEIGSGEGRVVQGRSKELQELEMNGIVSRTVRNTKPVTV